ncbi:glycoside hydrolase family 2 protein [Microbacterium sp. MC2]
MNIDLSGRDWTLVGWRRNDWELARTPAAGKVAYPDVATVPATVPGSVTGALQRSGVVSDPTVGVNSRAAEWVEHRDWEFSRVLADGLLVEGTRLWLDCEGLDYVGTVLLGQREVGRFRGSFVPHAFDLTDAYRAGERKLRIILTGAPDGLAQNGWTSKIRDLKPRFNYGWDWTPRTVSAGITGAVRLRRCTPEAVTLRAIMHGDYDPATRTSTVEVRLFVHGELPAGSRVQVIVDDEQIWDGLAGGETIRAEAAAAPWQISGRGEQRLHNVLLRVVTPGGVVLAVVERRIGFRRIEWAATANAPEGCDRWLCVVNGEPVFLAGVNWVPIRPQYADLTEADYRSRLERYRDLGVVMVRVWGGAGIERPEFYRICDELGLLVWQDFPMSSSGLDNEPPSDPDFIAALVEVAESYVERLAHHPSLTLWSGGNELTHVAEPGVPGSPLDVTHPTLAALRAVVERLDPRRRYVATTPTGPRFEADPAEFGRGVHHDVHGPWEFDGDLDEWHAYWDEDDAVMRSEVGVAGASDMDLLARHGLTQAATPEELRQLWTHSSGWWLSQLDKWLSSGGDLTELAEWVEHSQLRQAEMLGYAARRSLERFPACAGFLVWLGHDTFPCAVSLSLLDSDGAPKPAASAFGDVFASPRPADILTPVPSFLHAEQK